MSAPVRRKPRVRVTMTWPSCGRVTHPNAALGYRECTGKVNRPVYVSMQRDVGEGGLDLKIAMSADGNRYYGCTHCGAVYSVTTTRTTETA